jgi:hypothetical protein
MLSSCIPCPYLLVAFESLLEEEEEEVLTWEYTQEYRISRNIG